jgi:hypothetical protein
MANTFTSSTLNGTYKDDFDADKGYYKLLFNTGRALQARELTQMQSIIQNEIASFGRNIFKEGAAVNPGGPSINARYEFIKLNTASNDLPADTSTIVGTEFTGQTSGIKARVLEVVEATGADPDTIYVQYTDTSAVSDSSTAIRMTAGEDLSNGAVTLTVQTTNTTSNPAIGTGVRFSCGAGDFFAQGHFVYATAQSIILSKYSDLYTGVVGFKVVQDVVTAVDDNTLYDNSGASPDTTSPGADRLRIQLVLIEEADIAADEDFVFYAYIVDSEIYEEASPSNDYNIPQEMLATRTFEESGNYVVRPFKVVFEDHATDTTKISANISPGTAYVNGYRAHIRSDIKLDIDKSQTDEQIQNQVTSASYGNYVKVTAGKNIPAIGSVVNLRSAVTHGGSTMGTAAVRYVHDDGTNIRLYLFNIAMNSGQSFRNVRSIGTSTSDYMDTVQENSKTVLYEANSRNTLFSLPYSRPKSLTDISLEVGRRFTGTSNGSGQLTITLTATGETFTNTGDWIVIDNASGGTVSPSFSGTGTQSVTISGLSNSTSYSIWSKVDKSQGSVRTKTLTTTTVTAAVTTGADGTEYVDLGQADIYEVTAIKQTNASGADLSNRFVVDTGRRAAYYDQGRLVVPSNQTAPGGNVYVEFSYFSHGSTGDFYAVNSYIGQVDYADIPNDTLEDGTVVNLRDVLDFRPTYNGSSFTNINELPENSTGIRSDVTYYHARADLIVINKDAELFVVQGEPGFNPQMPNVPENTMELFRIVANPFTLNVDDLTMRAIKHKRYTMQDIATLDDRIEELRELTTLSLLELDTANLSVYDSAGADRTKSGFLVDNFVDHVMSDTTALEYRASIDPQSKIMRPMFNQDNIRLMYDSDKSSNVILKGDNLYLDYDEISYVSQPQVSGTENINPFAVVKGEGFLTLSPASDEWKEVVYTAAKAVSGGTRLVQNQSMLWNEWLWNWAGTSLANGQAGQEVRMSSTADQVVSSSTWSASNNDFDFGGTSTTTASTTTTTVARVISSEVISEVIDDRVVDLAVIPFMRSRKVYFKAEGLRPNSQYFAFFDGVDVNDWVREEAFTRIASDGTDNGNLNQTASEHPDGKTDLVSNSSGEIQGSFFIPSTESIKFRCGTRQLKLLDVSVNDDLTALSRTKADYTAAGVLETRQKTIKSTREVTIDINQSTTQSFSTDRTETWRRWDDSDPLAQSFFVSDKGGVYITKVAVYFQSKDDNIPVQLQLRTVQNGVPTTTTLPGAVKFLAPADVNVVSTQTQAGVIATPTYFEFDEPVYLAPGENYAVVLLADSVEYNVYVAETEQFILGSSERRITRQPAMGSLFKSQNGTTWTASQKQDLTFELFRAEFDTAGGEVILENADVPAFALQANPFTFVNSDATVTVYHPNHGFDVNDTVTIAGVSGTVAGITAANLNGNRTVTAVDQTGYTFEAGSSATSSEIAGGTSITATRNQVFDIAVPFMQTLEPNGTLINYAGKFTTSKSLAGVETRFAKDSSYFSFANRENLTFNAPRMIANPTDETSELGAGERSASIRLTLSSNSDKISPVIDLQRASLFLINNLIDKQASSTTTGFNVPLNYVAETEPTGGSHIAKHITKPVTLAEDAVGMKIILSANRPSEADFQVYYRTSTDGAILGDASWTLIAAEDSIPSDDNPSIYREYRYLPGGDGGSLDPFTQLQVKIVMRSTNSSKVPVFRDLRVIALAD